jgi:hypothetical protein
MSGKGKMKKQMACPARARLLKIKNMLAQLGQGS